MDVRDRIRLARELADDIRQLTDAATVGETDSYPGDLEPSHDQMLEGFELLDDAEMLLRQLSDELEWARLALAAVASEIDGWGDVDLHEAAYMIALRRDPGYEGDPEPGDYAQALVEAVLRSKKEADDAA